MVVLGESIRINAELNPQVERKRQGKTPPKKHKGEDFGRPLARFGTMGNVDCACVTDFGNFRNRTRQVLGCFWHTIGATAQRRSKQASLLTKGDFRSELNPSHLIGKDLVSGSHVGPD